MTLSKREKYLLIFGGLFVAVVLYTVYFLLPWLQRQQQSRQALQEAQQQAQIQQFQVQAQNTLQTELQTLNAELADKTATVPTGMDSARMLLYLNDLFDGNASDVQYTFDAGAKNSGSLLYQTVAVDFVATEANLNKILATLAEEKLYNKVQVFQTTYRTDLGTEEAEQIQTGGKESEDKPAEKGAPEALKVHLETYFIALPTKDGTAAEPALAPATDTRDGELFPAE